LPLPGKTSGHSTPGAPGAAATRTIDIGKANIDPADRLIAMTEAEGKPLGDVVVDAIREDESLALNIHLHGYFLPFSD